MTIAQQLKVKEFPFIIKDDKGREIYYELPNEFWWKTEYFSNGNVIYIGDSNGSWVKQEYDIKGKEIYFESSWGTIMDNRPKAIAELTMDEIAEKFNIPV